MAAILDENRSIDLQALHRDLVKMLPPYARPLFVRLLQKVDTTGELSLITFTSSRNEFDLFVTFTRIGLKH